MKKKLHELTPNLRNGLKLKGQGLPINIWNDKSKFDDFMQDLQIKKTKANNE